MKKYEFRLYLNSETDVPDSWISTRTFSRFARWNVWSEHNRRFVRMRTHYNKMAQAIVPLSWEREILFLAAWVHFKREWNGSFVWNRNAVLMSFQVNRIALFWNSGIYCVCWRRSRSRTEADYSKHAFRFMKRFLDNKFLLQRRSWIACTLPQQM
jgi:hypothetical protein